ncbi:hypothetical protein PCANC_28482 [Puccinia coronata f. sp. avenae]|uniref:Uncharacterized protein n=1 Tax=Puccinia coronata f. sp. avenae TaxID=200324 RepID=A0A2N5TH51_9BASI|nr:hypothetical protein PCANC_28482 [Puccinia coronata f. sp. avenae]
MLMVDSDPAPWTFIITKLKDTYDGILGMLWMKKHGYCVDWSQHTLVDTRLAIATTKVVPSVLTTPSRGGDGPGGTARKTDGGVCVVRTLALPQRKLNLFPMCSYPEIAGKQEPPLHLSNSADAKDPDTKQEPFAITNVVVSSVPKNPSMAVEPKRTARLMDEGTRKPGGDGNPKWTNCARRAGVIQSKKRLRRGHGPREDC